MSVQNEKDNHYLLKNWRPENKAFWENKGQAIARRNLWISVTCLLLAFCVWMLFSAVAVNLNKVGFHFTTDQLFLLTALPSLSGAILRVPYSFMVPLFGGRYWTVLSTVILIVPCIWLGVAIQNSATPFWVFIVIALQCGFAGANFASSMGNISFFFPKAKQGSALGVNGGLGNLGVSVMQMVAPAVIFLPIFTFLGVHGVTQPDGSTMTLSNAALVWVPLLLLATVAAWFGMNDIAGSKASIRDQLPVLKRPHMWLLSLLYLATFGSFIGFSAGFAMLAKTQFPAVDILKLAFFGPFIGALARSFGGIISDRLGGVLVDLFYDHLLARDWSEHGFGTLENYNAQLYAALDDFSAVLPERAWEVAARMRAYDWLTSYRHAEAVGEAIDRMAIYRLRRANSLAGGIEEFFADPEGFTADFREFLPDALSFAQDWRARR